MLAKPKILIVDDKRENLVALEIVLKRLNVEFVRALSGNEALSQTLKHEFCSWNFLMSRCLKWMALRLLSLSIMIQDISYFPVFLYQQFTKRNNNVVKGIETGAVDFISKPIIPAIIQGKVRVFFRSL